MRTLGEDATLQLAALIVAGHVEPVEVSLDFGAQGFGRRLMLYVPCDDVFYAGADMEPISGDDIAPLVEAVRENRLSPWLIEKRERFLKLTEGE